jgi:regulator of sirC expression with transglutaminase-like and TPR domain
MNFPPGRQQFIYEISQPDSQIDLGKAALYISQEAYPELDVDEYLNALDTMAEEIQPLLPQRGYPLKVVQTINAYLYDDLDFQGNIQNYYDPDNSFLNRVIDRRIGIPITLALVYLEVAKRLDFPMVGIGMPGHFLIRPEFEEVGIFVDAFHNGEVLFEQDCENRLQQIYQAPVQLQPQFLAPVTASQFLTRILTNLHYIYMHQEDFGKALGTVERMMLLVQKQETDNSEVYYNWLRLRGLLYYQVQQPQLAIQDLQEYLEARPDAEDADTIQRVILELTTQL